MPYNETLRLVVNSIEDVIRCSTLSSLLEVSGWPKPGNVHRTYDFEDTRFEHFLAAIAAIQPTFMRLAERIQEKSKTQQHNYSFVQLGYLFKVAVEEMIKWQKGGNVILGHILILAPLIATTVICLNAKIRKISKFREILKKVINDSTVEDTIDLYEAIRLCNPGGLGKIAKYDLTNEDALHEIQHDNVTLQQIFQFSQSYDLISREYSTGFQIILNEGLPYYLTVFNQTNDINIATVETFLYILAHHEDTLIIRKSGKKIAQMISKTAAKILEQGGIRTKKGKKVLREFDEKLHSRQHHEKLNPGTTADLTAGIIFCALIFGVKF